MTVSTTFPNTSKLVKNTPLRVVFSTLFSAFGNLAIVKQGRLCFDMLPAALFYGFFFFSDQRKLRKLTHHRSKFMTIVGK